MSTVIVVALMLATGVASFVLGWVVRARRTVVEITPEEMGASKKESAELILANARITALEARIGQATARGLDV